MILDNLNHVTIRTSQLDETRRFYRDVLGMAEGYRPPFNFPGSWLYVGERPVVHLIGDDGGGGGSGTIDHIAFEGSDLAKLKSHFDAAGVPFRERQVPDQNLRQLFLTDPNGVVIEINVRV